MADPGLSRIIDIIVRTLDPDTIILFGSRARGDAREDSDFDICVLKNGISERRSIAKKLYRALYGVGVPVPEDITAAADLTEYAVHTRYPGLYEPVSAEEYREALAAAECVHAGVLTRIP
ncbi:MAG: nucleotidyltransferase domain-containing protein [Methanoregulaceae archaeon]